MGERLFRDAGRKHRLLQGEASFCEMLSTDMLERQELELERRRSTLDRGARLSAIHEEYVRSPMRQTWCCIVVDWSTSLRRETCHALIQGEDTLHSTFQILRSALILGWQNEAVIKRYMAAMIGHLGNQKSGESRSFPDFLSMWRETCSIIGFRHARRTLRDALGTS